MLTFGQTAATSSGSLLAPVPARRSPSAAPAPESANSRSFADTMADVSSAIDGKDDVPAAQSSVPDTPASSSPQDAAQPGSPGWAVASQAGEPSKGAGDRGDRSTGPADTDKSADPAATDLTVAVTALPLPVPTPILTIPDPALGDGGTAAAPGGEQETGGDKGSPDAGTAAIQSFVQDATGASTIASTQAAPQSTRPALPPVPQTAITPKPDARTQQTGAPAASAPASASSQIKALGAAQTVAAIADFATVAGSPTSDAADAPVDDSTPNQIQEALLRTAAQATVAAQVSKNGAALPGDPTGLPAARASLVDLFIGERTGSASADGSRPASVAGVTEAAVKAIASSRDVGMSFGFDGGFAAPKAAPLGVIGASTFAATLAASTTGDTLPAGTANQIVQAMRLQWANGTGEAHIQLQPDTFGAMTVSLRVENGQVVARVQADSPVVREWLQSNQATLRHGLAEQNLTLSRLEVAEPPETRDAERRDGHPGSDGQPQQRRQRRPVPADEFELLT